MPPDLIEQIDRWASKAGATRSEAIRRLVELGLKFKVPRKPTAKAAARAAELAAEVIDKHLDPKTPAERRDAAKLRLIKGPSVFRDMRKDRQK